MRGHAKRNDQHAREAIELVEVVAYAQCAAAVVDMPLKSCADLRVRSTHARLRLVANFSATHSSSAACIRFSLPTKKWSASGTMTSFFGSAALANAARSAGSGEY